VHIFGTQESILAALTMASLSAFLIVGVMARQMSAQDSTSALVVRVAIFATDQGRLDDYRDFIEGHLFPTLRNVPGYAGTFLGRYPNSGQLLSLSFWRSEADAVAGEEAVVAQYARCLKALRHDRRRWKSSSSSTVTSRNPSTSLIPPQGYTWQNMHPVVHART
jgi:heme-degrading monooxygenase HmoA